MWGYRRLSVEQDAPATWTARGANRSFATPGTMQKEILPAHSPAFKLPPSEATAITVSRLPPALFERAGIGELTWSRCNLARTVNSQAQPTWEPQDLMGTAARSPRPGMEQS